MSDEILAHGTRLVRDGGRLVRVVGRDGAVQVELAWDGARLRTLVVAGYGAASPSLELDGEPHDHAVLGAVQALRSGGVAIAAMSAWQVDRIPAIDRPAALPAGTGTMLLATIARLAQAAGVAALRYAGPYPTDALWGSLAQCFRTDATAADFTADAATRWAGLDRAPIAIDFAPAPFERVGAGAGVFAQLRDRLERVVVDGAAYDRGAGVRRLSGDGEAALWFGDQRYAAVARFAPDGSLVERTPLPTVTGAPVGQAVPPALVDALASLVVELVPAPLAALVPGALTATPIVWGDAGPAAAIDRRTQIVLHAALWHALAPHGLSRLALALAEALAPIAAARAVASLSAAR